MEERLGIIAVVGTGAQPGRVTDKFTGEEHEYSNPANVVVQKTDEVIYVQIITGNGKVISVLKSKKA